MSETVDQIFLRTSGKTLEQLASRIRDCLAKLEAMGFRTYGIGR